MFHHPDQLHSLSKIYHEEALKEAQVHHLEHRVKEHRRQRSEEQELWSRLGKQAAAIARLS
jgi:hypothetical protein